MPIVYKSLVEVLVKERAYSEEILEFDMKKQDFVYNGLVIDVPKGLILKLGENNLILRAFRAFTQLSEEEVEEIYGAPAKYNDVDVYNLRTPTHYIAVSYFESYSPAIYATLLEQKMKTKENIDKTDLIQIAMDMGHAATVNYKHFDTKEYIHIDKYGYVFKALKQNIEKIIYKQTKMLEMLKILKSKGISLFINSNSHYEYV